MKKTARMIARMMAHDERAALITRLNDKISVIESSGDKNKAFATYTMRRRLNMLIKAEMDTEPKTVSVTFETLFYFTAAHCKKCSKHTDKNPCFVLGALHRAALSVAQEYGPTCTIQEKDGGLTCFCFQQKKERKPPLRKKVVCNLNQLDLFGDGDLFGGAK